MKMRLTPSVAAQGAWLIAGRSAAGVVLLAAAVSACTVSGSGSPHPSVPGSASQPSGRPSSSAGTRAPSPAGGGGSTPSRAATRTSGAGGASAHASFSASSPHASSTASVKSSSSVAPPAPAPTATPTSRATHTAAPANPAYPTAPPETGGGGTAGLQDGVLFGAGGLAVLAGLGSLAYRRRLSRKFGLSRPASGDQEAPRDPANR